MSAARPAEAARAGALTYADELRVGERFELGTHTVAEAELVGFAASWDPQWFHLDREAAEAGPFGGLITSGIHTVAILQRLTVDAVVHGWAVLAGRGIRELRLLRPVYVGDTITGTITITEIDFDDRERALVTMDSTLTTTAGRIVATMTTDVYLHASAPAAQ
ncbi:MaoC/PaaZ C-terminal domain-containing protein [Leucobacter albus]|uniref:MaoC/PaaZ C-terminal domain-containing protein n=1 Tax=Leucobacter albus TaxID=272210 RepID=A0ABW3TRA9_9MICO